MINENKADPLVRWRKYTKPDNLLTWGEMLTGDSLVEVCSKYTDFSGKVLEIGPGYGRFLGSVLKIKTPLNYIGIDISKANIDFLNEKYKEHTFIHANCNEYDFEKDEFNVIVSFLTFKHQYPTFELLLRKIYQWKAPNGVVIFDIPETTIPFENFEEDRGAYIRFYLKPEITTICRNTGFKNIEFDSVTHMEGKVRTLVILRD
jgi:SAM-dependent methyltransferase